MPIASGVVADRAWVVQTGGGVLSETVQSSLWPLPINWQAEWRESYEFNTEIIPSRDQSEQRRALRKNPRVSYEFRSTLLGAALGVQARLRLAARQSKQWVVPHGRFWARTAADIPAGTTGFSLSVDPAWAAVGREVVFRGIELGEIATYTAGTGTLSQPAINLIPAGTPMHLGVRGRMEAKSALRLATTIAGEVVVNLLAEPGGHYVPPAGAAVETYNGLEVWTEKPNWSRALSIDYEAFQDVIDMGFGIRGYVDPVDFVARTFQAEFMVADAADLQTIYGLFVRSLGKRTAFYMPAWNRELVPGAITTTEMTFAGDEAARLLGVDPSHKHVAIFRKDGTKLLRAVEVLAISGSDSVLAFDDPIPALTLDDIHYVTWLLPTRFFADRLQLDWVTNTTAVATVSFLTTRDETP